MSCPMPSYVEVKTENVITLILKYIDDIRKYRKDETRKTIDKFRERYLTDTHFRVLNLSPKHWCSPDIHISEKDLKVVWDKIHWSTWSCDAFDNALGKFLEMRELCEQNLDGSIWINAEQAKVLNTFEGIYEDIVLKRKITDAIESS